jgi:hypothetical protein
MADPGIGGRERPPYLLLAPGAAKGKGSQGRVCRKGVSAWKRSNLLWGGVEIKGMAEENFS